MAQYGRKNAEQWEITIADEKEIARTFYEATNKKEQIKILADMYVCKTKDIQDVLKRQGFSEDEVDMRKLRYPGDRKERTPKADVNGVAPSNVAQILTLLRAELTRMEKRAEELPSLIEGLQKELETLDTRRENIEAAIVLVEGKE